MATTTKPRKAAPRKRPAKPTPPPDPMAAPADLEDRGRRMWDALLAQDATLADELNPNREVAVSTCRAADRLAHLEDLARVTEAYVENERGGTVTHPVHVEVRQSAALLARLVAALRLPDDATGKRPQRRQLRGVQRPPVGKVSSLDRARAARAAG